MNYKKVALLVAVLLLLESEVNAEAYTYEAVVLRKNKSGESVIENKSVGIDTETGLITWYSGDAGLGLAIENIPVGSSDLFNPVPDLGLVLPVLTDWPDEWESNGRMYKWEDSYVRILGVELEDVRKVIKLNKADAKGSDSIYYYSMKKGLVGFAYLADDGNVEVYWLSDEEGLNYYDLKDHFNETWWNSKN